MVFSILEAKFQRQAFTELATADESSLLVLARGLGLDRVARQLVSFMAHPTGLVVAVGVPDQLLEQVLVDFSSADPEIREQLLMEAPVRVMDSENAPLKRQEAYMRGGVVFTTPRILLLDLLQERLVPNILSSLIVYDAHKVSECGMEAFAVDLIFKQNRGCKVIGLSDSPEQLLGHGPDSFGHFERLLKALRSKRVFFYPRFRKEVSDELDGAGAVDVVEVGVKLGKEARAAQVLLLDLLQTTVKGLLSHNQFLDPADFSSDLALSPGFESKLLAALAESMHSLTLPTAKLLEEVRAIRAMINANILCRDRQQFRELVEETYRAAASLPADKIPSWLSLDSAELLQRTVKELDVGQGEARLNPKLKQIARLFESEVADGGLVATESEQSLSLLDDFASGLRSEKRARPNVAKDVGRVAVRLADPYSAWLESAPGAVVLFDLSIQLVRQLEVYKATTPDAQLKVYYLMFVESTEEQKYLQAVRRERDAFEKLIRTHANLPLEAVDAEDNEVHEDATVGPGTKYSALLEEWNDEEEDNKDIIVDLRELRSALPFILHQRGFRLIPITLETADYVVADSVGIERKTVSDLLGSLGSGRLLSQSERLCAQFSVAILLIELDSSQGLLPRALGSHLSMADLQAKLCLLLLHRPRLRLLWSTGPHATAAYFSDLKRRRKSPGPGPSSESRDVNLEARAVLLQMRGVLDERNVGIVMRKFKSLKDLFTTDREGLMAELGNELGLKLYEHLHRT